MHSLRSIPTLLLLYLSTRVRQTSAQFQNSHPQAHQALFIRDIDGPSPYSDQQHFEHTSDRIPRQSTGGATLNSMDQTVQGILEWLQGKYANARKARQETPSRQYLPSRVNPTTTQKPRPFQTNANANGIDFRSFPNGGGVQPTGYPYPSTPNPTFNIPDKTYSSSSNPPPYSPVSSTSPPYSPSSTPSPSPSYNPPSQPPSYNPPSQPPSYNPPSQPPSYNPPSQPPSYSSPSSPPSYGSSSQPTGDTGPSQVPFIPSTGESGYSSTGVGFPSSGPGISPTGPSSPGGFPQVDNNIDSDESHPPHIHEINVQCAKDMMTIDIEFNRPFNGIIYSKVNDIAFHPIHGTLATVGSDGTFSFWDKDARTKLKPSETMEQAITKCAFNHNGQIFAYSVSYDWAKGHEFYNPSKKNYIFLRSCYDELKPRTSS